MRRTYSTLIGQGKGLKTRLLQVVNWVGGPDFDGCLVFDEVSLAFHNPYHQCVHHIWLRHCPCRCRCVISQDLRACSATRPRTSPQERRLRAQRCGFRPITSLCTMPLKVPMLTGLCIVKCTCSPFKPSS